MFELLSAGRAPDSVVPDFHTSARQDVLEKPSDEILGPERDMTDLPAAIIAIAETDHAIVEGFQAIVGDGDAEDVAAEVVEDFLTTARVLRVNDPCLLPD